MVNLSIIIPVFNCGDILINRFEYLKPLYSSNINFEIIFINDGSTDNSKEVLLSIKEVNDFITIISQENQGTSIARNVGIEIASGQYIQFLDADDYIVITEILIFLEKAISNDIDVFSYLHDFVDENKNKLGEKLKFLEPYPYHKMISGEEALIAGYFPYSACVFLFKRTFINENQLRFTPHITHEDVELMLRIMLKAKNVYFVETIAYHYVQRSGSLTKSTNVKNLEQFLFDNIIVANLMFNNIGVNTDTKIVVAIERSYNDLIWSLLWRFITKPNEVSINFKLKCLKEIKERKLYPIRGHLISKSRRVARLFLNQECLLKLLLKRK